ncbi:protein disulfide-isomerase A4-like [Saccoglossus kowalevskii]|uniref:Protein disulfide-isomerase A4-like n=1 Tax=Saccoglossus kowalevskii TaxID=10224 RepID=A0ABM0GLW6_SACKO|nr:PREDICTED: protein disulfide-isomerase A4-like [Saccoglossus kowalevskii]
MKALKISAVIFGCILLFANVNTTDEEGGETAEIPDEEELESLEPDVQEENDVLVLTQKNFDDVVPDKDIILVEFYAPWCGHCKQLAPHYEKAAKRLKENDPPVLLAKVDATEESELGTRYDVSGYPTLKVFRKGEAFNYEGPREEEGIVKYMKEQADPNWKPPPEAVITLTEANFDEIVNEAELILVEFYAPWFVGCTGSTIQSKYEKVCKFGIISYMQKQAGDSSIMIDDKKALKLLISNKESDISVVGFFESKDDELYQTYLDTGNSLRDDFDFMHTFDKESRDYYKAKPGNIVMFVPERFQSKYEEKRYVWDKSTATTEELKEFYKEHQTPLVGERTTDNQEKRYSKKPLVVVYYTVDFSFDHRVATQIWRDKIVEVAKDFPSLTFAIANEEDFEKELQELELADSGAEMNAGIFAEDGTKYKMKADDDEFDEEFREFVENFVAGKLKPVIKSQPVPKKNDGPVTIVVGKTFNKIVLDKKKDVLIELYAPWCGHCKNLEPIYKKLGKKYKKEKNLVIAKMDATANDVPPNYSASGFPTIYFAPANSKDSPLKFDNTRDLAGFTSFLEEKSTVLKKSRVKEEL